MENRIKELEQEVKELIQKNENWKHLLTKMYNDIGKVTDMIEDFCKQEIINTCQKEYLQDMLEKMKLDTDLNPCCYEHILETLKVRSKFEMFRNETDVLIQCYKDANMFHHTTKNE